MHPRQLISKFPRCTVTRPDGTTYPVQESLPFEIKASDVPPTTDVVLVIEAGACNMNQNLQANFRAFYQKFDRVMMQSGLTHIRYQLT